MHRTIRTLFSGGELFGVGARAAGFTHVDGVEFRADIAAVAARNGFDLIVSDVCAVNYAALPFADHLHASPSCKNASNANTDAGETPEDIAAADAVCRAIEVHKGRTFSLENVYPYRNFDSFRRIRAALARNGFVDDFDEFNSHINAADFGVPQTRRRLILRAVRKSWRDRVPPLHPTHREGGDMFHAPWVGWYSAIEDIIPTLPESKFAKWQLERLPDLWKGETALIVDGQSNKNGETITVREADEPMYTCSASMEKRPARALLIAGANDFRPVVHDYGRKR